MDPEEADPLRRLLIYEGHTAGGLMTTDYKELFDLTGRRALVIGAGSGGLRAARISRRCSSAKTHAASTVRSASWRSAMSTDFSWW